MRIPYSCSCDKCRKVIDAINDENDVNFNSLKQVYCPECYSELMAIIEKWKKFKNPIRNVMFESLNDRTNSDYSSRSRK